MIKNAAKKAAALEAAKSTTGSVAPPAVPATVTDGAEKGTTPVAAGVTAAASPALVASPFDKPAAPGETGHHHHHYHETSTKKMMGFNHVKLEPLPERLSSLMTGQVSMIDPHLSSVLEQLHSFEAEIATAKSAGGLRRVSMYAADTGFANEEVPLNDEHYYIPLWQRIILRSTYVLLITLIACIMPFFGAMAGLVGAVTFFPLAVYFPFACYRKVQPNVSKGFSAFLWVIWVTLLCVACAATIGSVRTIIVSWSTFKIFGT